VFSTYFGGSGADGGDFAAGLLTPDGGVAVEAAGNAFLAGSTTSVDLPVAGALQPLFRGVRDAFVAKFGPAGAPLWATYLGGGAADAALAAATDPLGNVYVAGTTASLDFPASAPAAQPVKRGSADGFVAKLGPAGALFYSTFLGGSNDDAIHALFADAFGRAHVAGRTNSPDFPLVQPVQGPAGGASDAFVAVLGGLGTALEAASYLGGTGAESALGVFADPFGVIYLAGTTDSLDFPLVSPLRLALGGASDAFLARLGSLLFAHAAVLPIARSIQAPGTATFFASVAVAGAGLAVGCRIAPVTPTPTAFLFQETDPATNALVGAPNQPVSIPAGGVRTFLLAFTAAAPFDPTAITLEFACANTPPARLVPGVNQPVLGASATAVPDVVALAATASGDGVVALATPAAASAEAAMAGAFSVATVNLGAGGPITVSADDGGADLGLALFVCRTDPGTSVCQGAPAPSLVVDIGAGETPTFGVFAVAGAPVPFDPARHRVFARFRDPGGVVRGATSVAVRTP
jgi:hypothetical protein